MGNPRPDRAGELLPSGLGVIGKTGYSDNIVRLYRYTLHALHPPTTRSVPGGRAEREREPRRQGARDVAVGGELVARGPGDSDRRRVVRSRRKEAPVERHR